jgi:hypothetical protein
VLSRDHLTIEQAMRRAELFALGASDELVQAVLATGSATDLRNGAFWRTAWTFLIANASAIDLAQVGPMLDFVQAIRHARVAVETPHGIVLRDPPQPSFSIKGRTVPSMPNADDVPGRRQTPTGPAERILERGRLMPTKTIALPDAVYERVQQIANAEGTTVEQLATKAIERDLARRWFDSVGREGDLRRGDMSEAEMEAVVEQAVQQFRTRS